MRSRIALPAGSIKHVHTVGHPAFNANDLVEFVGTVMDVTERKLAEKPYARQRLNWRMSHG